VFELDEYEEERNYILINSKCTGTKRQVMALNIKWMTGRWAVNLVDFVII